MPPSIKDTDRVAPSASTTVTRATPSAAGQVPDARGGAICVEIPLEVHGTQKPSEPGKPGEPFHEETTSVIVFPHGGVLRLAAPVAPGQMIAVTNQNTQRGMLCRILNVRSYPNLKGYVEVEFTQTGAGFWGVAFTVENEAAPEIVSPVRAAAPKPSVASITSAPVDAPPVATSTPEPPKPVAASISSPIDELTAAVAAIMSEAAIGSDAPVAQEITVPPTAAVVEHRVENVPASAAPNPKLDPVPALPDDFWSTSFPEELFDPAAPAPGVVDASPSPFEKREKTVRAKAKKQDAVTQEFVAPASHAEESPAKRSSQDIPAELAPMISAANTISLPAPRHDDLDVDDDASQQARIDESARENASYPPVAPNSNPRPEPSYSSSLTAPSAPAPSSTPAPAPSQTPSASSDALKELERLAMAHVGESVPGARVLPAVPPVPRPGARDGRDSRSASGASKPGGGATRSRSQEKVKASRRSSPLRSFTAEVSSPSASDASLPVSSLATNDNDSDFGGFLQDPEPRTSSPRVFTGDADVLSRLPGEVDTAPKPLRRVRSSTSIGVVLATGVALVGIVAAWVFLGARSSVRPLQSADLSSTNVSEPAQPVDSSQPNPLPESLSAGGSGSPTSTSSGPSAVPTASSAQPDNPDPAASAITVVTSSPRKSQPSEPARRSAMPWVVLTAPNPRSAPAAA
jgi:hypothetical protein